MMVSYLIGALLFAALKLGVVRGIVECHADEVMCLQSGRCVKTYSECMNDQAIVSDCQPDEVFCLQTGRCIKQEPQCPETESSRQCKGDEVFCLSYGKCVKANTIQNTNCNDDDEEMEDCPFGMVKCLQTGKCVAIQDDKCKVTTQLSLKCSGNEVFCIQRGHCVPRESNSICDSGHNDISTTDCPDGKVMCLQSGLCVEMAHSCGQSKDSEEQVCGLGETFCLEVGKCVPLQDTCQQKDGTVKNVCDTGQVFCLDTGQCLDIKDTCKYDGTREKDNSCNSNEVLCLNTGQCVAKADTVCKDDNHAPEHHCNDNEIFCLQTQRCLPKQSLCFNKKETTDYQCSGNEIYCLQTGECVPKESTCTDMDEEVKDCSPGEVYCLQRGTCVPKQAQASCSVSDEDDFQCGPGEIFCLQRGTCVPRQSQSTCSQNVEEEIQCGPGEVYCLQRGTCVSKQSQPSCSENDEDDFQCGPGEIFCLQRGTCVPRQSQSTCSQNDEEEIECGPGEVYCLQRGTCVSKQSQPSCYENDEDDFQCGPGEIFCLQRGTCVPRQSQSTCSQNDEEKNQCGPGEVYCLQRGTCVSKQSQSSCSETDEDEFQCGPGEVYCLAIGKCVHQHVSKNTTCDNREEESLNATICPQGYIKCLMTGNCIQENTICNTSTRQINNSSLCNANDVFCSEHGKCVANSSECNNQTGTEDDPQSCGDNQVLCMQRGKCVSLPASTCQQQNVSQSEDCQDGMAFCLQSGKCVPLNCNVTVQCGVGLVFCEATNTCLASSDCEKNQTSSKKTQCPKNEFFCPLTGECVSTPSCPQNVTETTTNTDNISTATNSTTQESVMSTNVLDVIYDVKHVFLEEPLFIGESYDFVSADVLKDFGIAEIYLNCTENIALSQYQQTTPNLDFNELVSRVVMAVTSEEDAKCNATTPYKDNLRIVIHIAIIKSNQIPLLTFNKDVHKVEEDTKYIYFSNWMELFNLTITDDMIDIPDINVSSTEKQNITTRYREKLSTTFQTGGVNINMRLTEVPQTSHNIPAAVLEMYDGSKWITQMSADINPKKDMFRIKIVEPCVCRFVMELHQLDAKYLNDSVVFEIVAVNDAPVLTNRAKLRFADIIESKLQYPYVHTETEFEVTDIINQLYTDNDKHDVIGMAVIGQLSDKIGQWDYFNDSDWTRFPMLKISDFRNNLIANSFILGRNKTIRFVPNNSSLLWSRRQAMAFTKLIVLAVDDSLKNHSDFVMKENIHLHLCDGLHYKFCGPGGRSEYSRDIVPLYINRVGCDGVPSSGMKADSCGVCGGHNDCIDCMGVPNGGATFDMCGDCTGGGTGIPYGHRLDCNYGCGVNYFEPLLDTCIRNGTDVLALLSMMSCDMVLNSGAFINKCGYCVTGNTSFPADHGMDACHVCHGDGTSCVDCNGTIHGEMIIDSCGQCLNPSSSNFNKGCMKLISIDPKYIRSATNYPAVIKGVQLDQFSNAICKISGPTDIYLKKTRFRPDKSIIEVSIPVVNGFEGLYNVSCSLDNTTFVLENALTFYSFPTITNLDPSQMTVGENVKVNITVSGLVNTGHVRCIHVCKMRRPDIGCFSPNSISLMNIPTTVLDDSIVQCDLQRMSHVKVAGPYKLSITMDDEDIDTKSLSSADFKILAMRPVLKGARFDKSYCHFVLQFDTEINFPQHCPGVLDKRSVSLLGSNPACMALGKRIMVKLGDGNTILPGDVISIMPSTVYPLGATPAFSGAAEGTVNISSADVEIQPEFSLVGPSVVGSCDAFSVILRQKNVGCLKFSFMWSARNVNEGNATQYNTTDFARRISSITSSRLIQVYSNEIAPGETVTFTVKVSNTFNGRTYNINHTVYREVDLIPVSVTLDLLGNSKKVDPGRIVRFRAKAAIAACYNSSEGNIKYSWQTGSSDFSLTEFNDKPYAAIRSNTLRGGETYTVTVNAFLEDDDNAVASAAITFHTESKPLVVTIGGGEHLMFSNNQDVVLDASSSRDPDRTNSPAFFAWSCAYENGFPCFIRRSNVTLLLSGLFTFNERVVIPALTLSVNDRLIWTVKMTVGSRSGTFSTTVDIVNLLPPSIDLPLRNIIVNPNDKLRIPCTITSFGPVMMTWSSIIEDGYDFIDIKDILPSDILTQESSVQIRNRDFSLYLDLSKETEVPAGTRFMLAVTAYDLDNGNNQEMSVSVIVNSPPTAGDVDVFPLNGTALQTEFTISIGNGWTDLDGDSTLFFFYVRESSSSVSWLRLNPRGLTDVFMYNFIQPEGSFDVMVEVCDPFGACSDVQHMYAITVEPIVFTTYELDSTATSINEALKSDMSKAIGMAMAFSSLLTSSDNSTTSSVSTVINDVATSLLTSVVASIDPADATSILDTANSMLDRLSSSGNLDDVVITESQSLAFELASYVTGNNDQSRRRRRRSTYVTVNPMSVQDAGVILSTYSSTFSSQEEESILTQSASEFLQALDNIMVGVCVTVSYAEDPVSIRSGLVTVNVDKRVVEQTESAVFDVSCSNCSEVTYPAKIKYGISIQSLYTHWNCSAYLSCYGACFASAQLSMDLVTPTSVAEMTLSNRVRRSDIVILKMVNPVDYTLINVDQLQHPISIHIPIIGGINASEYSLQCMFWHANTWTDTVCTSGYPVQNDLSYTVICYCSLLGYIAVFEGPPTEHITTTLDDLVTTTEIVTTDDTESSNRTFFTTTSDFTTISVSVPLRADAVEITFTIDADYSSVVGLYTNSFISVTKQSIAETMQISVSRIVDMTVRSGSIIVKFTAVKGTVMDVTLTVALQYLQDAIASNSLIITKQNGEALPIIKSSFMYNIIEKDTPEDSGNTNMLYIILGCVGGLLVIAVIIIGGLLHKMKKNNTTINNSPPPPYGPQMHGVDVPRPASSNGSRLLVQEKNRKKSRDDFIGGSVEPTSFNAGHGSTKKDIDVVAAEKGNVRMGYSGPGQHTMIGSNWVETEIQPPYRPGSAMSIPGPADYMPPISG